MDAAIAQPLLFERILIPKVWGGRELEQVPGLPLTTAGPIGESWELVDRSDHNSRLRSRANQASSGASAGSAAMTGSGASAGSGATPGSVATISSLRELMRVHAPALLGKAPADRHGRFPLLVKHLDARQPLSVQVHPSDESAVRIGGSSEGKCEAAIVLAAAPGAVIWAGLKPGVTREQLREAANQAAVLELLMRWEARPGQCYVIPGGTVHAHGAGLVLFEVQQNSDTTYRLWDFDRLGDDGKPRPIHLEQALAATEFGAPPRPPIDARHEDGGQGFGRAPLARTRSFAMNSLVFAARARLSTHGQFQIYTALRGSAELSVRGGASGFVLRPGDVWLVPAALDYHYIEPAAGGFEMLQILHRA